jgi:hypothetical protein
MKNGLGHVAEAFLQLKFRQRYYAKPAAMQVVCFLEA